MSDTPISNSPVIGGKVDPTFDKDGYVIAPSTIANDPTKTESGHNPDFFASTGETAEQENEVGKGANPSADVVTKNDTTIDPVFREVSPTADGETVPFDVPASLPEGAPVSAPDGSVHEVGDTPIAANKSTATTDYKLS